MPYRDAGPTVRAAAESVLAQEGVALELLAVDDGSSDDGPAQMDALARRDSRLVPLRCGAGLVPALEMARRAAKGAILARMDADDECLPRRLAAQVRALEEAPGVVATRVALFGDHGEGMARYVAWQNSLLSAQEHARDLFVESPICHPSVALPAALLEAAGGYRDGDFPEDYELWLRLAEQGASIRKVPMHGLRWRQHGQSFSRNDRRYRPEAFRNLKAAHVARRLPERPLVVWGAGQTGKRFTRSLEAHGPRASRFVDIDPKKIGRHARGVPVVAPEAIGDDDYVLVAVGARGARAKVRAHLLGAGHEELTDFRCVA